MGIRVAINGFGRIGRMVFRIASTRSDIHIVAINDLSDAQMLAHLLEHDTIHGRLPVSVTSKEDTLIVGKQEIPVFAEQDPVNLPWKDLAVDVVIEATGRFTQKSKACKHIDAGAKKVLISAPAENEDITLVMGVNEYMYNKDEHHIISNGSCTTNALAPLLKVLEEQFGVENAFMSTVHSYTSDQNLVDAPHRDYRRARAAAENIIPTSTGAAKAIHKVIPTMEGKINGLAIRVPTRDVSIVDVTATVTKKVSVNDINQAFKLAATKDLEGILQYTDRPLVSQDYIGSTHSVIFDSLLTQVVGDNQLKILGWYDNEFAFSARLVDQISFLFA